MTTRSSRRRIVCGLTAVVIVCGGIYLAGRPSKTALEHVRSARQSLRQGDFAAALESAEAALDLDGDLVQARMYAADAAAQLGHTSQALKHILLVPGDNRQFGVDAQLLTATLYQAQHMAEAAEQHLRIALQLEPQNPTAHRLLARSLSQHGRRWESLPHLLALLQSGQANPAELRLLAAPQAMLAADPQQLAAMKASNLPYEWLAAGCTLVAEDRVPAAKRLLERSYEALPDIVEADLRYGRGLVDTNDFEKLSAWHQRLSEAADTFPETWLIRAAWSDHLGDPEAALFCLWNAVRLHPNHSEANYSIGQLLNRLQRSADAEPFLQQARQLRTIMRLASVVSDNPAPAVDDIRQLIASLEAIGRPLEALAWLRWTGDRLKIDQRELTRNRLRQQVQDLTTWTQPGFRPGDRLQPLMSDWRPPHRDIVHADPPTPTTPPVATVESTPIAFDDVAAAVGLGFRYHFGAPDDEPTHRMFETTGGGVACLDVDHDDWPDLYFTQAGLAPPFLEQSAHSDALYRNRQGTMFHECTVVAGLQEFRFGQGVAAGDINNDGFSDLYVANIDGNQLFINNGDGSFSVSRSTPLTARPYWTTSCAIADLNGDTIPDLYDVTYITGDDALTRRCEKNGLPEACSPGSFACAPDVCRIGDGAGGFLNVSAPMGIQIPDGDGLGLVVGAFGTDHEPRIFVANDGRANFYFRPQTQPSPDAAMTSVARYQNEALARGIAYDQQGRAQACMGIAAADFNGDLRCDFFVTNFFIEANTLYLQTGDEHFQDQSRALGLYECSVRTLGFGTQPLDADSDGWPDLIVANGHINAQPTETSSQRMRPQFFRNLTGQQFQEIVEPTPGAYFDRPLIGRSMAVLDWNRDGRQDAVVVQVGDPAALLQNATQNAARSLTLRLIGRTNARDVVGAKATLQIGNRRAIQWLTAGDGYQCSNEKRLSFGLGTDSAPIHLTIGWPDGTTRTLTDLSADSSLVIREGDARAYVLPQ